MLTQTANKLVDQMSALKTVVRPRISGDLNRPEIVIRPRPDLAANLGVTTSALSQAIRIATLGDIDQNSAKFSLADPPDPDPRRTRPGCARQAGQHPEPAGADAVGRDGSAQRGRDIGFGAGPTKIERLNLQRRLVVGADLAPGVISGVATKQVHDLPVMKNLPIGVSELTVGQAKWQAEMLTTSSSRWGRASSWSSRCWCCLYRRFMSPLVNMGSLLLAPLGGLLALMATGNRCRCRCSSEY